MEISPQMFQQNMPFQNTLNVQDPNFSQWQLNPSDVMEIIEHSLRGDVWDFKKKTWEKKGSSKMNEKGIQAILSEVNSRVNKITIMSNLDEKSINNWLWDMGHELAAELFLRRDVWEIEFEDMDPIHDIVMILSEAALKRAYNEGERKRLYERTSTQEQIVRDQRHQQGGPLGFIPGLGGKG